MPSHLYSWPLLSLPTEILCLVLEHLPVNDLLVCRQVSQQLNKIISRAYRLQYAIELEKHCMSCNPAADTQRTTATRLSLLRRRESAWRWLKWSGPYLLRFPNYGAIIYEFIGGIYAVAREGDNSATDSICFHQLPSSDNPSTKQWSHVVSEFNVIDFTMDPAQNLLVLVGRTHANAFNTSLHIRQLSSSAPHPEAVDTNLRCRCCTDFLSLGGPVRVKICASLVGLLTCHNGSQRHLHIWDWRSGTSFMVDRDSGIDDFQFLSSDALVIALSFGCLELLSFDSFDSLPRLISISSYTLPPLRKGLVYDPIDLGSNPSTSSASGDPFIPSTPASNLPYDLDNVYYPHVMQRIMSCSLYVVDREELNTPAPLTAYPYVFFIRIAMFFEDLQRFRKPARLFSFAMAPSLSPLSSPAYLASRSNSPPADPPSPLVLSPVSAPHVPIPAYNSMSTVVPGESSSSADASNAIAGSSTADSFTTPSGLAILFPVSDSSSVPGPSTSMPVQLLTSPSSGLASSSSFILHHASTLSVDYAARRRRETVRSWHHWGPQNTRWFAENPLTDSDWQHSVYGLRAIDTIEADGPSDSSIDNAMPLADLEGNSPTHLLPNAPAANNHTAGPSHVPDWPLSQQASAANTGGAQDIDGSEHAPSFDDDDPAPRRYLRLRDFNSHFALHPECEDQCPLEQKDKAQNGQPQWKRQCVTTPSCIEANDVFCSDVVTSLPYTEYISSEVFGVRDIMLDDCRLVLHLRGRFHGLKGIDILTM